MNYFQFIFRIQTVNSNDNNTSNSKNNNNDNNNNNNKNNNKNNKKNINKNNKCSTLESLSRNRTPFLLFFTKYRYLNPVFFNTT